MFDQQVCNLRIGAMMNAILPAVAWEGIKLQLQVFSGHDFSYMQIYAGRLIHKPFNP
jgi:hypothetical protein